MHRAFSCLLAGLIALLVAACPAGAQQFSPEAVDEAIEKGVEFLWSLQKEDGSWGTYTHQRTYPVGPTAICVYALLESGVSPRDPRMAKALAYLRKTESDYTYGLAFRASAYAAAMKYDERYRTPLRKDVSKLIKSISREGAYTYDADGTTPTKFPGFAGNAPDNSNTQYGLLGVWAGQRHLHEVPRQYWQRTMDYWLKVQKPDGGWPYSPGGRPNSYMSMTLAGLASVYVCADNLYAAKFATCSGNVELPAIEKALKWVDENYEEALGQSKWFYYTLYGVERVGLASGRKYFGRQDWYKLGAAELIRRQSPNGAFLQGGGGFSDAPRSTTCYGLLFLLRGRRPVVINKLEYTGDWNNRPRDCAYLTRWMGGKFEREVAWQIVNLQVPVEEWHDAPILYISGARAPSFSQEELDKLRRFVWQGGTLLTATECGGSEFSHGIREIYEKLFPQYKLVPCTPEHEIYRAQFLMSGTPKLEVLTNGIRPLAIHTEADLPRAWQLQRADTEKAAFESAANAYMYVTGKTFRNRGVRIWPEEPAYTPKREVKIVRVKHAGNYDPEPLAYERFARLISKQDKLKITPVGPLPATDLPNANAKIATLTGTGELKLTQAEQDALRMFVEDGGTLVIDAAGGDREFDRSTRQLLRGMFGSSAPQRLSADAPPLASVGLDGLRYRSRTLLRLGTSGAGSVNLRGVMVAGRPAVLYSREDITGALLGRPSYTCDGYTPQSAYDLMRGIVLQAAGN